MSRLILSSLVFTAALVIGAPAGAQFTCSTVARSGQLDPLNQGFVKKFVDLDINQGGDVVFDGRTSHSVPRIYFYPLVGTPSVVVSAGDLAPNGFLYTKFAKAGLRALSINDAGDIGFWAKLGSGEGVLVRPNANVVEIAAASTDVSPGGGNFATFPSVSRVDATAVVAFVGTVEGGPDGVFTYDASTNTQSIVALEGDAAGGGRSFCSFLSVGLGGGAVAFEALAKLNCADLLEVPVDALYLAEGGPITEVVRVGDASPIPGASFFRFRGRPDVNASHQVAFRAQVSGTLNVNALFLFDPGTVTVSEVAAGGDTAPSGGAFTKQGTSVLDDAGDTYTLWGLKLTTAKQGIFLYDGTPGSAVLSTDSPPTDQFGTGSSYKKLDEPRAPRDGSRLAFLAKLRDTNAPTSKSAVLRCVP